MSVNGTGANYAPLKQVLSDSESEEEHGVENAFMKYTDSCNNLDFNSGLQSSKNYSISDIDDFNTNVNTLESTMESVSILQLDNFNKLSFPRKCAVFASLLVCLFTVVVFLWVLPCEGVRMCEGPYWDQRFTWEFTYNEIELVGKVQVVDGAVPRIKNLIFIYQGNQMKKVNPNDNANGVLLIVGNTGKVGWYTRENRIPTYIHCHLIDVNKDNQKDCIVSGKDGLLSALNPLSGTYYWYIHKQGMFLNITLIDFPIAVKDLNKDNVDDLLTVATIYPDINHNTLLLVSGATGNIISDFVKLDDCTSVKLTETETAETVSYICNNSTTESVRIMSYSLIMKINETTNHTQALSPIVPDPIYNSTWTENEKDVFKFGFGKLYMENSGECPDSCRVSLKLVFEKDGTTSVTWEYAANHVYAMNPKSFIISNELNGFIFKLREWNSVHIGTESPNRAVTNSAQNKIEKNPYDASYNQPSANTPTVASCMKYTNFTAHNISERIVLVTFDKVQMHIFNVTEEDVLQLCPDGQTDTDSSLLKCQPYLDEKSSFLEIEDLNGDSYYEVIIYYSTFIAPEQYSKNPKDDLWRLMSVVKVIKLESILP